MPVYLYSFAFPLRGYYLYLFFLVDSNQLVFMGIPLLLNYIILKLNYVIATYSS